MDDTRLDPQETIVGDPEPEAVRRAGEILKAVTPETPVSVDENGRANVFFHRVGQEVWQEFYMAGLRVRFEHTREDVADMVTICQALLDRWDADTELIAAQHTGCGCEG